MRPGRGLRVDEVQSERHGDSPVLAGTGGRADSAFSVATGTPSEVMPDQLTVSGRGLSSKRGRRPTVAGRYTHENLAHA